MNANIQALALQMFALTLEEQRELNHLLCDNIKRKAKLESMKVAQKFNIGDKIQFDARTKGFITAVITGFSRDGSKIKCTQIGGIRAGCAWTAAANLISKA